MLLYQTLKPSKLDTNMQYFLKYVYNAVQHFFISRPQKYKKFRTILKKTKSYIIINVHFFVHHFFSNCSVFDLSNLLGVCTKILKSLYEKSRCVMPIEQPRSLQGMFCQTKLEKILVILAEDEITFFQIRLQNTKCIPKFC